MLDAWVAVAKAPLLGTARVRAYAIRIINENVS